MELETFITKTLVDVVNGLKKANELFKGDTKFELRSGEEIAFDIAITVTEGSSTSKGGGISVYALKLDGKKDDSDLSENMSKIKFKIRPHYNIK